MTDQQNAPIYRPTWTAETLTLKWIGPNGSPAWMAARVQLWGTIFKVRLTSTGAGYDYIAEDFNNETDAWAFLETAVAHYLDFEGAEIWRIK